MSFSDPKPLAERLVAAAPALLVQAAIGYALLSGLVVSVFPPRDRTLVTEHIPLPPTPPPDKVVEAPPPSTKATPEPLPPLPRPEVRSEAPTAGPAATGPVTVDPGPPTVEVTLPPAEPAPAVDLARGVAIRGRQGDWFPRDAYPAAARRAGAQGRVSVSVDVGTNGRVAACRVTASSGSEDLDAATCRLATRNGRFVPALDGAGQPVAATYALRNVRWVLEE